ncbi:hypothetical protein [Bosea sp. (in: a-proteobacteria)]|uniref:hypothetical protein n=1 Tax=Bosea sp. (in: a-proteobacteria) TaxID=1871050 RepID=UPI001AD51247|nr:hypothetical protein [Bosea sp. (in: a-proteobacteria)]MBN9438486.1 hypothetical protein [Bosea sp. (in: a-proteobacteria)]
MMLAKTRVRNIEIVDRGDEGAAVSFPRSLEMTASLRSAFPRCRWNRSSQVWEVPGKTAAKRVADWANGCAERLHELEPAAAIRHRRNEVLGGFSIDGARVSFSFPYSADAVAIARTLPGARFDSRGKSWSFEPWSLADVDKLVIGFNMISALEKARVDLMRAREQAKIEQDQQRNAVLRHIELKGERCEIAGVPDGTTIWECAGMRGNRMVVLGDDGWLWLVIFPRRPADSGHQHPAAPLAACRILATNELVAAVKPRLGSLGAAINLPAG